MGRGCLPRADLFHGQARISQILFNREAAQDRSGWRGAQVGSIKTKRVGFLEAKHMGSSKGPRTKACVTVGLRIPLEFPPLLELK